MSIAAVAILVSGGIAACSSSTRERSAAGGGSTVGTTAGPTRATGHRLDDTLRLNQIQVLGTHNSYHLRTPEALRDAIDEVAPVTRFWDYEHPPLDRQFDDQGIRQIEIDVYLDPDGRFAIRHANAIAGLPLDAPAELEQPGLKVLHVPELDYASNCLTFIACLRTIKAWSDAHAGHVPLMVLVEAKNDTPPDPLRLGFVEPIAWDATGLDQIDAEIGSVFDTDRLITPDLVRADHATLEQAVLSGGWPTLGAARGKVMFCLDNARLAEDYTSGHPSLRGRVMFSNSEPGRPEAAFVKRNDAGKDRSRITDLVKRGYVVRTMADDLDKARADDTGARDAAIASGAQWVSTDHPVPDPTTGTDYSVKLPGGTAGAAGNEGVVARCNPVNAPPDCTPSDIEDPRLLRSG